MGFVPEDRRQQGLVMEMAIDHNVALASLRAGSSGAVSSAARPSATLAPRLGRCGCS